MYGVLINYLWSIEYFIRVKYILYNVVYNSSGKHYMDKKIILKRIDDLMLEKGVSKYQIREDADISSTIYQWRKNATRDRDRTPSLRSIEKICNYFEVSLAYFFAMDEAEQRTAKQRDIMELIKNLSNEQLSILEKLIKQFKTE